MNIIIKMTRVCLLVIASGLLLFDAVRAQETTFRGHVVDAQGEPVPSLTVSLHRVTQAGGAVTTQALSGRKGEFAFKVPAQNPDEDAVFFVATRYLGQLYLGKPFRAPVPTNGEYKILVGPGGVTADEVLRPSAAVPKVQPPPVTLSTRSVVLLLAITFSALAMAAAAFASNAPQRAQRQRRAVLLQLARLEEQQTPEAVEDADAQHRHDELFRRLQALRR